MNVSGGDATSLKKTTAVASNTTDPGFIISVVNTGIIFLGLALGTVGVYLLVSAEYTPPPAPAAYVVGNAFVIFGASLCLQALLFLITVLSVEGSTPENSAGVTSHAFVCAWGVALIIFGVVRFLSDNPFDYLADCPCPPFHAEIGGGCVPCPGYTENGCNTPECVCGTHGVCSETTATCQCEFNWQIDENMTCTSCSDRTMDSSLGECTRCTERFKPDPATGDCSLCRPGYAGADCKECHPNFEPRKNADGSVFLTTEEAMVCGPVSPGCKSDQPPGGGRSGIMCEPVQNCAQWGDVNARVRATNADVALAQPATFTFNGQAACAYDHECEESFNCRGICSWGKGGLEGALCLLDSDCSGGVCENRVCAVERRVGSTDCKCSRAGYLEPRCEACPGFNKIWASSVCGGGRGSCMAAYVDVGLGWASEYEELQCKCGKPLGTTLAEFPKYAGDYCEKIVDENGRVQACAEGYFGDDCSVTCEGGSGWGGAAVCSSRGTCKYDGNAAHCQCDADTKQGGIGYYSGSTCEACAGEFYSDMCQPCPGLQVTRNCQADSFLLSTNPTTCFGSCNIKTCEDGKQGIGVCV